ncbi:polysaccharide deacetylase family protein [Flavobacterium sp. 38-13]|uniref:polysaccharide deacetylase family protein n=1 Tax=Flavobacterium sp. 38-13 TaxID=1896168 RepID=UPI000A7AF520|nr:polysaccharide deacetylase family protein [Flavobacterium sp. 38-13]
MEKYICFRFDIDTHICLQKGVPNLLKLFENYNAKCTFFVSMGRSFDRSSFLKEKFKYGFSNKTTQGTFSMFSKLGVTNSIVALLLNPKIGAIQKKILQDIINHGHELGLHGGKNHTLWEKNAKNWNEEKILQEIDYGLGYFRQHQLPQPISFASPCWQSPLGIDNVLRQRGFSVLADEYFTGKQPNPEVSGLLHFPTNVLGQHGNVGFVENLRALGYSSEEILSEFEKQLDSEGKYKMVFDHPFYIGIKEIEILSKMIEISIRKGYKVDSLHNISKHI